MTGVTFSQRPRICKSLKAGTIIRTSYDYSVVNGGVNNIGQRKGVRTTSNLGGVHATNPGDTSWGYDSFGQVTSVAAPGTPADRAYLYDGIGNRKRSANDLTLPPTDNYVANALNQYSTGTTATPVPGYDLDGNATTYAVPAYPSANSALVWDGENRLVSATVNGVTTTYLYDAFGRRIATQSGYPSPYVWIYDGWNPIVKYYGPYPYDVYLWGLDLSGTLQGAGGVGGLLAVSWDGFDTFYPTYDGNGNVSEYIATNTSVDAHFEYDAFGNVIESTGLAPYFPFRFSTKQQDDETGLLYYGYRYYDPLTGRWPSRDPIGERGGVNLYGFVGNDAILLHDYLGMWDRERVILIMCQSQSGANIVDKLNKVVVKKSEFSRSYRRNVGSSDWEVYNWGALTTTGKDGKKTIHVPKDSSDEEAAVTLAHESAHADGSEKGDTPWQKSEIDAYARETRFAISVGIKPNEKFVDKYDATRVNIFGIEDFVNQAYKGYYEGSNDVEFKKDDLGAIIYEFGNESDETPWKCAECMPPTSP